MSAETLISERLAALRAEQEQGQAQYAQLEATLKRCGRNLDMLHGGIAELEELEAALKAERASQVVFGDVTIETNDPSSSPDEARAELKALKDAGRQAPPAAEQHIAPLAETHEETNAEI